MPADLQSAPFGRSGTPPGGLLVGTFGFQRAGDGNRTHYLLLTRQLLYQVSYASETNNAFVRSVPLGLFKRMI